MNKHQRLKLGQERLVAELQRLQTSSRLGTSLKVIWIPSNRNALSGEVKGDTIYIYEENEQRALETLHHEFLDYCVSRAIEPYREVTNKLIAVINEEAYKRKEQVVAAIARLSKELAKKEIEDT